MMLKNDLISFLFTCSCPVSPTPFVDETVFPTLCIIASFVIDELTISAYVCFWVFYPVSLISISIFVPMSYFLMTVAL